MWNFWLIVERSNSNQITWILIGDMKLIMVCSTCWILNYIRQKRLLYCVKWIFTCSLLRNISDPYNSFCKWESHPKVVSKAPKSIKPHYHLQDRIRGRESTCRRRGFTSRRWTSSGARWWRTRRSRATSSGTRGALGAARSRTWDTPSASRWTRTWVRAIWRRGGAAVEVNARRFNVRLVDSSQIHSVHSLSEQCWWEARCSARSMWPGSFTRTGAARTSGAASIASTDTRSQPNCTSSTTRHVLLSNVWLLRTTGISISRARLPLSEINGENEILRL